jgi:hypothetical protein
MAAGQRFLPLACWVAAFVTLLLLACSGKVLTGKGGHQDGGAAGGEGGSPVLTNIFVDSLQTDSVTKIDLLLMVDNSIAMADKELLFSKAIPELVARFTSPLCVDPMTFVPDRPKTPADPSAACPAPLTRQFTPIRDIHLGIITSSLGGHGSTTLCVGSDAGTLQEQETNDHGWLIGKRQRFMTPAQGFPPESAGFLDWNPAAHAGQTLDAFGKTAAAMTLAAGEFGCGLESQLESIYRFLVDPNPYQTITQQNCPGSTEPCSVPTGIDMSLLAQRAAFLRNDSAVAVVMLTDENDCSIQERGQYFYAARDNIILPHGSSVCATNPNDPCCYFCNAPVPPGCDADPTCQFGTPRTQDQPNLRCFQQMRRFGFDFLYPTKRYVNALTEAQICTSRADLEPDPASCKDLDGDQKPDIFDNPLFVSGTNRSLRDRSLVFFGGIVGVPWQDLATNNAPGGTSYPPGELHFRTASQLLDDNVWPVVLGEPDPGKHAPPILPADALMIESKDPRSGTDGENPPRSLAGTNAGYLANPVNGHEYVNSDQDDLQYACIFPLSKARDCAELLDQNLNSAPGCDCHPGRESDNNPICQQPNGQYSTSQAYAKAYPSLRELQVLKDFGANAIVASVCPRNVSDPAAQDYGYRPALDALVDTIGGALQSKCLPRVLIPDPKTGDIPCTVMEVTALTNSACDGDGRTSVSRDLNAAALNRLKAMGFCDAPNKPACGQYSVCGIEQAGAECHQNHTPTETGWCYIDPSQNSDDDVSLVASCPASKRRLIRFVDPTDRTPAPGAIVLISCFGPVLPDPGK